MAKDIIIADIFKNGDFNVDYSDEQHINHVITSAPGHFKQHPLIGVNILQYVNAPMSPKIAAELERNIQLQLEADGAKNIKVSVNTATTEVNATATYN
ncbi:MAG: hypothetical protein J0G96_07135 [Flavobacteriia bacterium]|nr:hypothetical protein [Flavobacteriia bacterium]OJX36642.1 MAG: hypothetical protein BGO87_12645 [Flavobacteriia bacterium 40-80]